MCLYTFKEGRKVIVGVAKVVEFIDNVLLRGQVDFILGASVSIVSENKSVVYPIPIFLIA